MFFLKKNSKIAKKRSFSFFWQVKKGNCLSCLQSCTLFYKGRKKKRRQKRAKNLQEERSKKWLSPLLENNALVGFFGFFYLVFFISRQIFFFALNLEQIKTCLLAKYTTLQNCNNSLLSTQGHENESSKNSDWCTNQKRKGHHRNKRLSRKLMQKQMTRKYVTIETGSQTHCTKSKTNRFKENKKRCYRPTWSSRQKETWKEKTLSLNSFQGNCSKQSNTQSLSKTSSSSNSRKEGNLSYRIGNQLEEKQNRQPMSGCFSASGRIRRRSSWERSFFFFSFQRKRTAPCSRNSVCLRHTNFFMRLLCHCISVFIFVFSEFKIRIRQRSNCCFTPFKILKNSFLCLSVPKCSHGLSQCRQSTGPSSSFCMRGKMISNNKLKS